MRTEIVFIGSGRMASAIVSGLLENKHYAPESIVCTGGGGASAPRLAERTGIRYEAEIAPSLAEADALVLACKPQQLVKLDPTITAAASGKMLLSVLAGTTLGRLGELFVGARNIIRTMPNTPGQIGAGVTAYAAREEPAAEDLKKIEQILGALGAFHRVEEAQLDAVTAVSGSGPAYVFEFVAAMREAGVTMGLDAELAEALATETVYGAAKLLRQSDQSPEGLRDAVTSPNGTTAAALGAFEAGDLRGLVARSLKAARDRSLELASE